MERRIYEVYGMHPQDVDLLTFREMLQMLGAARDRERTQMRASAEIVAAIYNFGGMSIPKHPKGPSELYPDLYPGARAARARSEKKRIERAMKAHERYASLIKSGATVVLGEPKKTRVDRGGSPEGSSPSPGAPLPARIMKGRRRR